MPWLEQFLQDLRFAARSLAKGPAFTALAALSLAIGIMGVTAIYSVLSAVVLHPFPYKDVDRLASVRVSNVEGPGRRLGYSVDQFLEIAERSTIFEGVIASTISDVLWTDGGEPQRLRGNHGTFNTFDVMGVPPLLGRTPGPDDAKPGAAPVVVLGYRFWQRQFGGDPQVLSRQLKLNDTIRTVIGVMPKRFMWRGADVYLPVAFARGRIIEDVRTVHLLGRVKPGVTAAQAEADLAPIIADLKKRSPDQFPDSWRVSLLSFEETFPSSIRGDIWVLFGAVSLLLLIACANVSNLLLSKVATRAREMSVRAALGANRARVMRQLLTESLLLALVAGVLGTAFAYAGLPALLSLVPPGTIPDESEIVLDHSVLAFALAVSALTSVACGLAPALHGSRRDLAASLRESGRGLAGGSRQAMLRKALVVLEVALALVLLAGSSLLVRTYLAMQQVGMGVEPERVLTMRVPLPPRHYPDAARRSAFSRELLERVKAIPGVRAAGVNTGLHPLGTQSVPVNVTGMPPSTEPVLVHQIDGGYTTAMGIRLASGRLFTDTDVNIAARVALANERFIRARLDGRPPLGQIVRVPRMKGPPMSLEDDGFRLVGVVHDAPNRGLAEPVMPEIYVPFTVIGMADLVVVRAQQDAASVARAVVRQVHAIDANQPVTNVKTLDALLDERAYATPRFNLALLSVFAALGLVLAVIGVYGVMANSVAQQRHEIGVRLALGAGASAIARMVLMRGSGLLAVGLAFGLAGSIAVARLLARQVWNVSPFDPVAFAVVALVLFGAGLQACVWPARRAARIDPLIALRQDE